MNPSNPSNQNKQSLGIPKSPSENKKSPLSTLKVGSIYKSIFKYEPTRNDELKISIGDIVEILESPDGGWSKGQNTTTLQMGWFPTTVLDPKPLAKPDSNIKTIISPTPVSLPSTKSVNENVIPSIATDSLLPTSNPTLLNKSNNSIPNTPTTNPLDVSQSKNQNIPSANPPSPIMELPPLKISIPLDSFDSDPVDKKGWFSNLIRKSSVNSNIDMHVNKRVRSSSAPLNTNQSQDSENIEDSTSNQNDKTNKNNINDNLEIKSVPETSISAQLDNISELKSNDSKLIVNIPELKTNDSRMSMYGTDVSSRTSSVSKRTDKRISVELLSMYHESYSPTTAVESSPKILPAKNIYVPNITWQDFLEPARLAILTPKERQRLTAIWEMITTERDYVRDLKMVIEVFMNPMIEKKVVPPKVAEKLFSNIVKLYQVAKDFLNHLEASLYGHDGYIENAGADLLKMADKFIAYTMYCSNQNSAIAKLQSLIQSTKSFKEFLTDTYKAHVEQTRNLDLASYLLKPIQRICKYPLIIREILKHTDPKMEDYGILEDAQEKIQAIITIVNEGARQNEGTRKLADIQNLFTEKVNFDSPNRYLVREDDFELLIGTSLKKEKARRVLLFNDLLIVARKDWRERLHMIEKASLRDCKVSDIQMDGTAATYCFEVEIGQHEEGSSEVLGNQSKYIFVCKTPESKKTWIDSYKILTQLKVKNKHLSDIPATSSATMGTMETMDNDIDEDEEERPVKKEKPQEEDSRIKEYLSRIKDLQVKNYDLENSLETTKNREMAMKEDFENQINNFNQLIIPELNKKINQLNEAFQKQLNEKEVSINKVKKEFDLYKNKTSEGQVEDVRKLELIFNEKISKLESSHLVELSDLGNLLDETKNHQTNQQKLAEKKISELKSLQEAEKSTYEARILLLTNQIDASTSSQRKETQDKLQSMKMMKLEASSTNMLQTKIKQLEDAIEEKKNEINQLHITLKDKTNAMTANETEKFKAKNEMIEMKSLYQNLEKSYQQTKDELNSIVLERSGTDLERETNSRQIQANFYSEKQKAIKYKSEIEKIQNENIQLKNNLTNEIQIQKDLVKKLEQNLADTSSKYILIESKFQAIQSRNKSESTNYNSTLEENINLHNDLKVSQIEIKEKSKQLEIFNMKNEHLSSELSYQTNRINELMIEISKNSSLYKDLSDKSKTHIETLDSENIKLKEKVVQINNEILSTREKLILLESNRENLLIQNPGDRQIDEPSISKKMVDLEISVKFEKIQTEVQELSKQIYSKNSEKTIEIFNQIGKISDQYQNIIQEMWKKTSHKILKERQTQQEKNTQLFVEYQGRFSTLQTESAIREEKTKTKFRLLQEKYLEIKKSCQRFKEKAIEGKKKFDMAKKSLRFKTSQLYKSKSRFSNILKTNEINYAKMKTRFSTLLNKNVTTLNEIESSLTDFISENNKLRTLLESKGAKCRELEFLCKTNIEHSKVTVDIIRDTQEFGKKQLEKLREENKQTIEELEKTITMLSAQLEENTRSWDDSQDDLNNHIKNLESALKYQNDEISDRDTFIKYIKENLNEKDQMVIELSKSLSHYQNQIEKVHVKLQEETDIREFSKIEIKALRKEFFLTKKNLDSKIEYVKELKECIINIKKDADLYLLQ